MKKEFFVLVLLFACLTAFSQTCPVISFSYDAAGNRLQQKLVIQACGSGMQKKNESKQDAPKAPSFTDSLSTMKINVFPSPAQDKVNVLLEQTGIAELLGEGTVLLYDSNGRILYSGVTTSNQLQIDVQNLVVGIYYLNVKRGNKQASYSIFKN